MEVEGCRLPEDRLYDLENDVWVQPSADGQSARVGLTAWIGSFAGKFLAVTFRPIEGPIERGRSVATVESLRYTGAVRLPVGGTVLARNQTLRERPKLLNDQPYDDGWVVEISPTDPLAAGRDLERADQVAARLAEKVRHLRIHCYPAIPDAELIEIGVECQTVLSRLDEEIARRDPEEVVLLVTDDPTAPIEMVRWEDQSGHRVIHHRREGNLDEFLVRRERHPVPKPRRG